jgi:hypothetical protein
MTHTTGMAALIAADQACLPAAPCAYTRTDRLAARVLDDWRVCSQDNQVSPRTSHPKALPLALCTRGGYNLLSAVLAA